MYSTQHIGYKTLLKLFSKIIEHEINLHNMLKTNGNKKVLDQCRRMYGRLYVQPSGKQAPLEEMLLEKCN